MKKVIITFCLILLASVSFAQSNAETQAVNELMKVMNLEQQINESAERMFEVQSKAMPQILPYKDVMLDFFHKYINWDSLGVQIKKIYTDTFTEAELSDLVVFYKTDTGQKLVKSQPIITSKMASISQNAVMEHQMELQQSIMNAVQSKNN